MRRPDPRLQITAVPAAAACRYAAAQTTLTITTGTTRTRVWTGVSN
ncbi:hypothetical protein J2X52_002308 [Luteimonas sp. 3794]|nr:hypothetical protein [Luteimonas sp. 3794]